MGMWMWDVDVDVGWGWGCLCGMWGWVYGWVVVLTVVRPAAQDEPQHSTKLGGILPQRRV